MTSFNYYLKVIMLVSEGREQKMFKDILANKDETNQKIGKSPEVNGVLYRHSPRIVPPEFNPQYVETFIKISNETAETVVSNTKGKKKSTKKATKVRHNVQINFDKNKFQTKSFSISEIAEEKIKSCTKSSESKNKNAQYAGIFPAHRYG